MMMMICVLVKFNQLTIHLFLLQIEQLQGWIQEQEDLKSSEQSLCLEKIVPGGYFNLVCQVELSYLQRIFHCLSGLRKLLKIFIL